MRFGIVGGETSSKNIFFAKLCKAALPYAANGRASNIIKIRKKIIFATPNYKDANLVNFAILHWVAVCHRRSGYFITILIICIYKLTLSCYLQVTVL